MDELRLILLALFVALIAGIYLFDTLRKRQVGRPQARSADEPVHAQEVSDARVPEPPLPPAPPLESRPEANGSADLAATDVYGDVDEAACAAEDGIADDPVYLDPEPAAPQPGFSALSEAPDSVADAPGTYLQGDDPAREHVEPVGSFSVDGPDVPLGNINLLEAGFDAEPAAGQADVSALAGDGDIAPFQQGQLDLDGSSRRREPQLTTPASSGTEALMVVLHVMRPDRTEMPAGNVQAALGTAQLELGEMSVYHHYGVTYGGAAQPVFSVARAVEPGTFDADDERTYATPGLTLFMRLPGPQDGAVVLELMFNTAQTLARDLEATVLDERRNPMSAQALNHLRDRVAEFSRRQKLVAS